MKYDILLSNGHVADGTGGQLFKADLAISDGRIIDIKKKITGMAETVIDVKNLVVSPGFIDMHSHSDISLPFDRSFSSVVRQGITTQVVGNCGWSLAPVEKETVDILRRDLKIFIPPNLRLEISWKSFDEYLKTIQKWEINVNILPLVGFGAIRIAGGPGYESREPTDAEMRNMKGLVREAIVSGAWGLSTGLVYTPQSYAKTEEIIELMKVAAKYKRMYFSHIRGEGSSLIKAVEEFITIVKESGARHGQIAHFKVSGKQYCGLSKESLKLIDKANSQDLNISCDQYPFNRGMTSLVSLLPDWVHEGGLKELITRLHKSSVRNRIKNELEKINGKQGIREVKWEDIYITAVKTKNWKKYEGLSIAEITKRKGIDDHYTTLFDIIVEEKGEVIMQIETMCEKDIQNIMRHPKCCFGTDGWGITLGGQMDYGMIHPRFYGTFPRILEHYVREKRILTLEHALYKMTGLPASILGLKDRGILAKGNWADIVVFDPLTIGNKATYKKVEFPKGVKHVIINGKVVVKNDTQLKEYPGKVLRDYHK